MINLWIIFLLSFEWNFNILICWTLFKDFYANNNFFMNWNITKIKQNLWSFKFLKVNYISWVHKITKFLTFLMNITINDNIAKIRLIYKSLLINKHKQLSIVILNHLATTLNLTLLKSFVSQRLKFRRTRWTLLRVIFLCASCTGWMAKCNSFNSFTIMSLWLIKLRTNFYTFRTVGTFVVR